jgi:hypothetical protein
VGEEDGPFSSQKSLQASVARNVIKSRFLHFFCFFLLKTWVFRVSGLGDADVCALVAVNDERINPDSNSIVCFLLNDTIFQFSNWLRCDTLVLL